MSKCGQILYPIGVIAETAPDPLQTLEEFDRRGILPPFELSADAALKIRETGDGGDANEALKRRTFDDSVTTNSGPGAVLMPFGVR